MTHRQKVALGKQIVRIANELGVKGWTWCINSDPPENSGHAAAISCVYGRRIANLWFSPDWWEMHPDERHHVLVHEILHVVVTDPIATYLAETLPRLVGEPAWHAIEEAVRNHGEHATDQLASALAPHIPVMEEPR